MKQNNLKTFGIVAVFLLLVSMLNIIPASASPAGAKAKEVAQAARQLTTDQKIIYKKNGISDTKMDSAHLVFVAYFKAGVTGYFGDVKPKNIGKCANFVRVDAPTTGDVVYWPYLDQIGIYTEKGEVITISKTLGKPSRVMINAYPYNGWPKYYYKWVWPAPKKL
jgi:hypothetical protein